MEIETPAGPSGWTSIALLEIIGDRFIRDDLLGCGSLTDLEHFQAPLIVDHRDREPEPYVEIVEQWTPEPIEVRGGRTASQTLLLDIVQKMSCICRVITDLQCLHERCLSAVVLADDQIHAAE